MYHRYYMLYTFTNMPTINRLYKICIIIGVFIIKKILVFLAAARMRQRNMVLTVTDTNSQHLQCSMPIKITIEADCPSYCPFSSSIYNRSTNVWKHNRKPKTGLKHEKKSEAIKRRQILLPSWKSEYQDSISKIGHAIMRAKLHHTRRKALPIQYQYCTTSS